MVSYEPALVGDLKSLLDCLAEARNTRWFGRPRADIGGHLLAEALRKELDRAAGASPLTQAQAADLIGEQP